MNDEPHLLAHAGAPSSRKGDDTYRLQLRAYMLLGSAQTLRIQHLSTVRPSTEDHVSNERQLSAGQDSVDLTQQPLDTRLACSTSVSQLFTTVAATAEFDSSVLKEMRIKSAEHLNEGEAADFISARVARTPRESSVTEVRPTISSQSSYLISPLTARPTKRRKLVSDIRGFATVTERADKDDAQGNPDRSMHPMELEGFPAHRNDFSPELRTYGTNESTSELPTSYSISDERSESEVPYAGDDHADSSHEFTVGSSEKRQQMVDFTTSKAPATIERDFADAPNQATNASGLVRPPLDSSVSASTTQALRSVSREINPPEPEVGHGPFSTHVTMAFQRLASNAVIARSYNPLFVARELRPLERGYWLVRCSVWPIQRQVDCWNFLEKVIQTGKLGWGVRCVRGNDLTEPSPADPLAKSTENREVERTESSDLASPYSFGPIKVYCWGETVRHVYLLLYTASESKVRRLGLQWFDAEGAAVVQMP